MTILNLGGVGFPPLPATSGTFNFSVTRDDIIREAMLNLALLEESEVPTAQEVTDCARKLNMIVKQLAGGMDKAPGFKMWQRQRGDLFLSPTQGIYTLSAQGDNWAGGVSTLAAPATHSRTTTTSAAGPTQTVIPIDSTTNLTLNDYIGFVGASSIYWTTVAGLGVGTVTIPAPGLPAAVSGGAYVYNYTVKAQRPLEIATALLRNAQGSDTPLTRMTLEVYEALPTKRQPGFVQDFTAFYYEPQQVNLQGQIFFDAYGAQDVTKHIHIVYLREAMDFNNPGDAPEFPQEWFDHLCWTLSLRIHSMFDVDWTQGMQEAFQQATGLAREANPQTTQAYFQPDDEDNC